MKNDGWENSICGLVQFEWHTHTDTQLHRWFLLAALWILFLFVPLKLDFFSLAFFSLNFWPWPSNNCNKQCIKWAHENKKPVPINREQTKTEVKIKSHMTNGQLEPYTNKMKSGMNEKAEKNQHKAKSNRLSERERDTEKRREKKRTRARPNCMRRL